MTQRPNRDTRAGFFTTQASPSLFAWRGCIYALAAINELKFLVIIFSLLTNLVFGGGWTGLELSNGLLLVEM